MGPMSSPATSFWPGNPKHECPLLPNPSPPQAGFGLGTSESQASTSSPHGYYILFSRVVSLLSNLENIKILAQPGVWGAMSQTLCLRDSGQDSLYHTTSCPRSYHVSYSFFNVNSVYCLWKTRKFSPSSCQ